MKIKKFKLSKDVKLIASTDGAETVFCFSIKGTGLTEEAFRVYINKCSVCGRTFLTKENSRDVCLRCNARMQESRNDYCLEDIGIQLDKLSSIIELLNHQATLNDIAKNTTSLTNNSTKTSNTRTKNNAGGTKTRKKYTFAKNCPKSYKYEKYIEEHKGNVVIPKNIDNMVFPRPMNKVMVEVIFDCVYKGKSITAIATMLNIGKQSVSKYLSCMSSRSLNLVYPAGDGLRYKVIKDVEVKVI